jgi:Outer membrane protein beta-barrel family/CarboxypepD_reg-like domain
MGLRSALLYLFVFLSFNGIAQSFNVTGTVTDDKDKSTLINVTVVLTNKSDTTIKSGSVTDADGNFLIAGVNPGNYVLHIEYIGYKSVNKAVAVNDKDVPLGTISMQSKANELKGVTVEGKQVRGEQLGDTSQFHADAFKTHPDATAEDLVTKMPGVTSDNSGVKFNGENVQQVYVDGKPFFGTDPTLALKNMPSEIVDKIQIFDKLSDQSTFTGFDDGNGQKTMNIVTRKGKSEGTFGKIYAGYGTDDRYIVAGNLNIFDGNQRISILGMSNNINQQNFSSEDLLGVSGGSSGRNRGGNSGGRGNFGGGGGGGANNFLVGQQGGITNTNSAGINYSDNWGKKIKVSGSYFFNNSNNTTGTDLTRNYFTSNDTSNIYQEKDNSITNNYNHRFNLRFEYTIDSFNSIIFTPGISFQKNNSNSSTDARDSAVTKLSSNISSTTANSSTANNSGYSSNNNLLIQHKFKKQRRTISLNISASLNDKTGDGTYKSLNEYYETIGAAPRNQNYDQSYTLKTNGYTVAPNVTYTEPIGKKGQLMFTYNPNYSCSYSDKSTYDFVDSTQGYTYLNDTFSNKYKTTYFTQKGGLSYRIGDRKMNFSVGANVQYAALSGERFYPNKYTINESFTDVLPTASYSYRFSDGRNLRINYRTNTVAPSVTQLQDLVDISNPLLLKTGNPDLKQDYEHTLFIRYGLTQKKSAKMFFLNVYANYINNYIGNATYTTSVFRDTITHAPVLVPRGSQLTVPQNLNGYLNTRTFLTYGLPVKFIKCNLNLSGGFNYTRTPGMVDNVTGFSNNYIPSGGIVLSSNISEKLDFTLAYYGNYNIVNNTLQSQASNNYYNHVASFKINYLFLKHFVFNTSITENYYTAFSSTANQDFYLWNAYLGYKFLKNNALEARITAYDILNQNKSVSRTVTETYIENNVTQVLKQYFLFQLTYTIRNFKGTLPTEEKGDEGPRPWRGGGGDHGH